MRQHRHPRRRPDRTLLCGVLASCLALAATTAVAQNTTATIRGLATTDSGPAANARITATHLTDGAVRRVQAGADGRYVLVGLRPGSYRVDAAVDGRTSSQNVTVQIGQSLTLNIATDGMAETADTSVATTLDAVEVTATQLIETKSSEVATNVSQRQIEALPQSGRNFLNFAALAPGITITNTDTSKSFSAAGQPANQTNVFIDGASQKNNVLQGGLVGQDSSKGNPFSQEAIQEFRVLTQNFKAEYEQAGTATITAITKSGSNEFHGSLYGFYQDKHMVEKDYFTARRGDDKPEYERKQYGATLGGPIILDKLHFFVSYEANHEDGNETVDISNPDFAQYNGTFAQPFEQTVWFGKLSWRASDSDNVDLSLTRRRDTEVIGFGGTTGYEARQERDNDVDDALLKWQHYGDNWLNELSIGYGWYQWSPHSVNPDIIAEDFQGCCRVGGANQLQEKGQKHQTIRNDLTFSDLEWHGSHVIKLGAKFARYELHLLEQNNANPVYVYNLEQAGGYDSPYQVNYSPIAKEADIDNNQIGLFIQDDWDISDRLQLNLGLRWDYETDPYNKDYVTPQSHIEAIEFLGLSSDYISTGDNREPDKNMFQPRLGFSYDFSRDNDQSWVLFGGAGRYYDRTPLDNAIQEQFYSEYPEYTLYFSPDGSAVNGNPATVWDDKYYNVEELEALIQSGGNVSSTIYLLSNETKSPYSDQFNLGVRHVMGAWTTALTLSHVLGRDQFTWIYADRNPDGTYIRPLPNNYGPVLINTTKDYESTSFFFTLDKPYTEASGWGFGLAYTFQDAYKEGGDAFSLDYVSPELYPDNQVGAKHRLVLNGIMKLPWDMRLSGLATFSTGEPYTVIYTFDYNGGPEGPGEDRGLHLGGAEGGAFRQVDVSLTKDFRFGDSQALQLRLDAFNVFDAKNFGCYEGYVQSENYRKPNCLVGPPRSFQVGLRYSF